MDKIKITGGTPLQGTITISGSKNAALPVMAASLLTQEPLILHNVPHLADITTMIHLLGQHGVSFNLQSDEEESSVGKTISLQAQEITSKIAPYDIVRKMRASVLVLGPLLARFGYAKVSLPGGCAIGTRPINLHLSAFEHLGATINLEDGYIEAFCEDGLKGGDVYFDQKSVGATENALMAACLADGVTTIHNAAREPEVSDLAHCLEKMGAPIEGIGTDRLIVHGQAQLHGAEHTVIPDRVETGSYMIAGAITKGEITLKQCLVRHVEPIIEKLTQAGISVTIANDNELTVSSSSGSINGIDIITQPHPGFPTDMQAQFMTLMSIAKGTSVITENIFENRFMHVPELVRMGANIDIHSNVATIRGTDILLGAPVMATDLRASVSLVLAGLAAKGETVINRVYHLDRGYECLEEKLAACGANIARVKEES